MHLRSLRLRGFKSFPDALELKLEPGVSVVVGPNGSGKSNVADAIVWAAGSLTPSELRADKPDDVLFNGAEGRKPAESCEVELVFDNEDGGFGPALDGTQLDFSEVSIARRLHRGGEGQYLVNRAHVRRTDLVELLADVGLSGSMHSIVSQGKVEAVLASKPEERRELVEEAAGLGKFKRRKHRAELKLNRVAIQVERARDVEAEVRKRLRPLALQATAAERAEKLAVELARSARAHRRDRPRRRRGAARRSGGAEDGLGDRPAGCAGAAPDAARGAPGGRGGARGCRRPARGGGQGHVPAAVGERAAGAPAGGGGRPAPAAPRGDGGGRGRRDRGGRRPAARGRAGGCRGGVGGSNGRRRERRSAPSERVRRRSGSRRSSAARRLEPRSGFGALAAERRGLEAELADVAGGREGVTGGALPARQRPRADRASTRVVRRLARSLRIDLAEAEALARRPGPTPEELELAANEAAAEARDSCARPRRSCRARGDREGAAGRARALARRARGDSAGGQGARGRGDTARALACSTSWRAPSVRLPRRSAGGRPRSSPTIRPPASSCCGGHAMPDSAASPSSSVARPAERVAELPVVPLGRPALRRRAGSHRRGLRVRPEPRRALVRGRGRRGGAARARGAPASAGGGGGGASARSRRGRDRGGSRRVSAPPRPRRRTRRSRICGRSGRSSPSSCGGSAPAQHALDASLLAAVAVGSRLEEPLRALVDAAGRTRSNARGGARSRRCPRARGRSGSSAGERARRERGARSRPPWRHRPDPVARGARSRPRRGRAGGARAHRRGRAARRGRGDSHPTPPELLLAQRWTTTRAARRASIPTCSGASCSAPSASTRRSPLPLRPRPASRRRSALASMRALLVRATSAAGLRELGAAEVELRQAAENATQRATEIEIELTRIEAEAADARRRRDEADARAGREATTKRPSWRLAPSGSRRGGSSSVRSTRSRRRSTSSSRSGWPSSRPSGPTWRRA